MNTRYILVLFIGNLLMASCSKDAAPTNENEIITDFIINLKSTNGLDSAILSFSDPDGDGGLAPVIIGGSLNKNTVYNAVLSLKGKHGSHTDDITAEIKSEATSHQFFFSTDIVGMIIQYMDNDTDNNPVGLESKWSTTNIGTGKVKIILRHKPNKSALGVKTGDITNAGGETDIEVEFNVSIQ